MADIIIDGRVRVGWVSGLSGIANIAAPTTTELNSGLRLDAIMTPDGLVGFEGDTASVDTSSLSSSQNTAGAGRIQRDGMALRLKKQDTGDTAFTTLTYQAVGFIVVRRFGIDSNTAWTSSQNCAVYPVMCGEYKPLPPEANSMDRYEIPLFLRAVANTRATIA
jgi:hypothetical protein